MNCSELTVMLLMISRNLSSSMLCAIVSGADAWDAYAACQAGTLVSLLGTRRVRSRESCGADVLRLSRDGSSIASLLATEPRLFFCRSCCLCRRIFHSSLVGSAGNGDGIGEAWLWIDDVDDDDLFPEARGVRATACCTWIRAGVVGVVVVVVVFGGVDAAIVDVVVFFLLPTEAGLLLERLTGNETGAKDDASDSSLVLVRR